MPIAPARCCKACISDRVVPADTCFDLNFCSGVACLLKLKNCDGQGVGRIALNNKLLQDICHVTYTRIQAVCLSALTIMPHRPAVLRDAVNC